MKTQSSSLVRPIRAKATDPYEIFFVNPYMIVIEHRHLMRIYCIQDLAINYMIELEEGNRWLWATIDFVAFVEIYGGSITIDDIEFFRHQSFFMLIRDNKDPAKLTLKGIKFPLYTEMSNWSNPEFIPFLSITLNEELSINLRRCNILLFPIN